MVEGEAAWVPDSSAAPARALQQTCGKKGSSIISVGVTTLARRDQVIREDRAQHGSVAGAPKNRQRISSVRRSGWSRNAGPQQWY